MPSPPHPHDEARRQAVLARYHILDSENEQAYDDLVTIAARICDAPIAAISLIDEDRQWFKSRKGVEAQQTGRDVSFCGHAILAPRKRRWCAMRAPMRAFSTTLW